jgi:hypothetical protein
LPCCPKSLVATKQTEAHIVRAANDKNPNREKLHAIICSPPQTSQASAKQGSKLLSRTMPLNIYFSASSIGVLMDAKLTQY